MQEPLGSTRGEVVSFVRRRAPGERPLLEGSVWPEESPDSTVFMVEHERGALGLRAQSLDGLPEDDAHVLPAAPAIERRERAAQGIDGERALAIGCREL